MDHIGASENNIGSHYEALQKPELHSEEVIPPPLPPVAVEVTKATHQTVNSNSNQL